MATRRYTASLATLALVAGSLIATTGATAAYAVDAVDGAQTAGDSLFPNQGNGGYDVQHYDLNLPINVTIATTSNAISTTIFNSATASIQAVTTGAPLKSFSFDFQGSTTTLEASTLNVDSVTVNGVPATFSRIETTTTNNAVTDKHKLIVTPVTPVDGAFTTVVTYSGRPVAHTDTDGSLEGWNATPDGATFVNQPIGAMTAFPNNNTPRDKATYTITMDIPTKLSTSTAGNTGPRDAAAVSNGELVSKTPSADGTRTTWVWNQAKPMASELSLISVGRYDMYHSEITLNSGRTIPEWTFIDPAIPLSNQTTTLGSRAQLKSLIDFFESKYGPYPGNSTGLVTDVAAGINYALETQDRSFFPTSASRSTTYHEVMHQWFGDGVSPVDWNDIWLNEGPATYSEYQFPFEGAGSSTTTVEQSVYALWNGTSATSPTFTIPPAAMTQASQLFGGQVYNRGAMTLEALRTSVGAATYASIMNQWQVRYSGQSKSTADFIALANEISGRDLTAFFQTWLYTPGKPAWPVKFNLTLAGPTAPVAVGDAGLYTLTARNTGKVAMPVGSVVTVDVSGVLDKATLGALPANVTLSGNTLTWAVPATALAATSSVQFSVVPNPDTTGSTLSATASVSTLGGTCIDCTQALVIGAQPVASSVPTITGGTPTVIVPLTAEPGTWTEGTTFSYQWLLDGTPIAGATSATYTPDATVTGLAVSVKVTGTNGSLSPVATTSAPTAVGVRGAFTSATTPTISGTPQIGLPLTVSPGAWDAGTVFTYSWQANSVNISGATGPTYTPAAASQIGQTLTATVIGTKAGRITTTKVSAATAAVVGGTWINSGATPTIAGPGRALAALAALPGLWDDGTTFTYLWSSNGASTGVITATYTPPVTMIGTTVTVTVTGAKSGYPTVPSATSAGILITAAAQSATPTPTITGTKTVGSTLTAVPGSWDAGTTLTYQWLADGVAIDGATATTLPITAELFGKVVNVTVTSTRPNYVTTSKTSTATAPITAGSLTTTPTPTISGDPKLGTELTATAGTWDDGVALSYQWLADGDAIAGAESATYTPGASQVGKVISVNVIGSKYGYLTVTKVSDATAAVAAGDLVDTPVPTITGTPKVGVALTAVAGTWDADTELAYQWYADDVAIDGAITAEYTPGPARVGALITVAVTGTKFGYTAVVKTSIPTAEVVVGDLVTTPTPVVVGTAKVDVLLTALPGTWDADTTFEYQWLADGDEIDGETTSEFTPDATFAGALISVAVTGTKTGYEPVTKTSTETDAVADGDLVDTPVPTIAGTATVAETLTATAGDWDLDTVLAYQWFADEVAIDGATAATIILSAAEVDKAITVAVTGTKSGYVAVTKTSDATVDVALATLVSTPVPTVTGTAQVGVQLSVDAGDWDADVALSYQWSVDGDPVVGAAAATFTPGASTVGKTVSVSVTGAKAGYVTVTKSSDATDPVILGTLPVTPVPAIAGTPKVGVVLYAQRGSWGAVTSFGYQWFDNGLAVEGATNSWFTLNASRLGHEITVAVTGSKDGYTTVTKTSDPTAPVVAGELTSTPVPTITGTARVGVTVKVAPGSWDSGVTRTFQWKRNGTAIEGATEAIYAVGYSDLGKTLTVVVTGAKAGYTSVKTQSAGQVVAAGVFTKQPTPTISGSPTVGKTLTAKGTYDAGVTLTYVWSADGKAISGNNKATFLVAKSLKGKTITVQVTVRKPGYTTVVGTSVATAKVS